MCWRYWICLGRSQLNSLGIPSVHANDTWQRKSLSKPNLNQHGYFSDPLRFEEESNKANECIYQKEEMVFVINTTLQQASLEKPIINSARIRPCPWTKILLVCQKVYWQSDWCSNFKIPLSWVKIASGDEKRRISISTRIGGNLSSVGPRRSRCYTRS